MSGKNTIQPVTDLRDLLLARKESVPEKIAFRYRVDRKNIRDVSFAVFAEEAEELGNFILSQGFNGKHIAISGANSYEWLLAFFAVTTSGNVAVAIDNESGAEDLKKFLLQSDSEALFCPQEKYKDLTESIDDKNFKIIHFPFESIADSFLTNKNGACGGLYADIIIDPENPAAIFFTSGTSGESKAVVLSHRGITSVINSYLEIFNLPDVTLSVLPFHHALGLICGVIIIMSSTNTVFINTHLKRLLNDLVDSSADITCVVPAHLEFFREKIESSIKHSNSTGKYNWGRKICRFFKVFNINLHRFVFKAIHAQFGNNLKTFIVGGAPINSATTRFFQDIGFNVFNGYGLTETSPVVTVEYVNATRISSCGKPLSCCSVRIAEDGEIFVKGDNVFSGYYKNKELTDEVLKDGEFATGDLGYLDEDGFLFITGRKKNLIVLSNGENISPEELEALIYNIPNVQEVIVCGIDNKLIAEVFCEPENYSFIESEVKKLNRTLPAYKQIGKVVFRTEPFEKTTSKKIKR